MVSRGGGNDVTEILFSETSILDYEKFCLLDFLGVSQIQDKPDDYGFEKLREQLERGLRGYYKTKLIWKENHLYLQKKKKKKKLAV